MEKETNKPKKTLHGGQIQKAHFFEIKVLVIVMMVLVIVVTVVVAVAKKGVDIKAVLVESRYMAIKREEKEVKISKIIKKTKGASKVNLRNKFRNGCVLNETGQNYEATKE